MKKELKILLIIIAVGLGIFLAYEYATEPKIVGGVLSKSIDDKGRPVEVTSSFSQGDSIYFSAKRNRFWIKEAQIVWYKGEIETENRFLVEEEVEVNDSKYFSSELTVPEGLEEGQYGVTIYVQGKEVIEEKISFEVEK